MAQSPAPDDEAPAPVATDAPAVVSAASGGAPKRLPWVWTILLLLILPAVGLGLWFGGTRHRVQDHPDKVKRRPRRLAPRPRPAALPAPRPAAVPAPAPPRRRPPAVAPATGPAARPAPPAGGM